MSRPPADADDLLVCADVLGAFGVTAADIRRSRTATPTAAASGDELEAALADVLADGRDRTTVLRRTIARSDRGFSCAARYAQDDLERELTAVFEAIGWSFECERLEPISAGEREQLKLQAADYAGRQRQTTFEYPETPLGTDNLPAVLWAVNDILLSGTDARFVLLSAGVDRWQAALVDATELERLRERYGPRITAVDRPLCPEHGLAAYVPDEPSSAGAADEAEPWPAWAHERESDGVASGSDDAAAAGDVGSLIEEAESGSRSGSDRDDEPTLIEEAEPEPEPEPKPEPESAAESTTAAPATEAGGYELCGGSPTVSRVDANGERTDDARSRDDSPAASSAPAPRDETGSDADGADPASETDGAAEVESEDEDDDEFGTLSGSTTTARVSNESFGSDVEWETEDDRYRALGAALGAGGTVTVRGLLEDDDFLPELPAAEPEETRIAFEDPFDPEALREAKAAAEESGFVWVDSGSLETTRVPNS